MVGRHSFVLMISSILLLASSSIVSLGYLESTMIPLDNPVFSQESPLIIFDYSHGQYRESAQDYDLLLSELLETRGYTVMWARGGLNETILADARALIIGSMNNETNGFQHAEIQAISDWFNEGLKFLWVGCDSDYENLPEYGQFINDNMTMILESVGSHVYPEPTEVNDTYSNAGSAHRVIANQTSDDPIVAPAVDGIDTVLMHSPTLLYGSGSSSAPGEGILPISLEDTSLVDVYPLLYYSHTGTISDNQLPFPYAHDDGQSGAFVAVTLETQMGEANSSVTVVSGSAPYGLVWAMHAPEYAGYNVDGDLFVRQTIEFGLGEIIAPTTSDTITPTSTTPTTTTPSEPFILTITTISIGAAMVIIIIGILILKKKP